jgi:predicted membrane channel-forming protein YqfA (hemolysin III family)
MVARTVWEAPMNRLGTAGVLWLVAAGFAIAMTLIFRTDPVQWVVTIAIGVVAAGVGLWLIARPSAMVVSASNVVAVVWTVLYAVLTVQQSHELAAWTTDVFLVAIGAAAGVVAYRSAAKAKLRGTIS